MEIKVNYLRAVHMSSGILTATGTLVKAGSRVGFTEGVVTDSQGKVVATASSTLLISDLPQRANPCGPTDGQCGKDGRHLGPDVLRDLVDAYRPPHRPPRRSTNDHCPINAQ